jgi:phosphatidylglycerophosphate synthase
MDGEVRIGEHSCNSLRKAGSPERDLGSVLSGVEKRLLVEMAERLPPAIGADTLTLLGLVGMIAAGLSFWAARSEPLFLLAVPLALFVNWFGDSLDGTVARVRGDERPRYGYYVDHVVDVFGAFFVLGGLGVSGYMSPLVAGGLMVAYLMVSAEIYLAAYAVGTFRIHFFRLGPTELRILFAAGTLYLLADSTVMLFGRRMLLFDVGGTVATAGLFVALVVSVARNTRNLYRSEPLNRDT